MAFCGDCSCSPLTSNGHSYSFNKVYEVVLRKVVVIFSKTHSGKKTEDAFHLGVIPPGLNGISITVTQDGKVIKEKIMLNITMEVLNK